MNAIAEPLSPAAEDMPAPILFTDSAAGKVKELVDEEGNPDLKLRVFVQGGGCSGFQYGFTFDEITNEDDTQMSKNGVTLLIDAMSLQYLVGAEIDYKELALPRDAFVAPPFGEHERELSGHWIDLSSTQRGQDRDHTLARHTLEEHVAQLLADDLAGVENRVTRIGRREPAGLDGGQLDLLTGTKPDLLDLPARCGRHDERQPAGHGHPVQLYRTAAAGAGGLQVGLQPAG